jgi:phosphoribosylformylglycinamidine synthase
LDAYWSDHCRHTTFFTTIDTIEINDTDAAATFQLYLDSRKELGREDKPINLMDIATGAARYLKAKGILKNLDESPEINACTVKIKVDVDGEEQDWLLLFKNETHNHPTEIEPFGGAATCLGGAIRDPLSGRAYVYQAMRLTGAADPTRPLSETIPGKLPQRKITTEAAAGYSSYGNQIGVATGLVDELYHPDYVAKRMEIGAVVAAAPAENVRREVPQLGDVIILLGGRTGRDGCGGAAGSSKSHDITSIETSGAEVQKGNPPEERKLQRLFRIPEAAKMIKRCNDLGAGGISVAFSELAEGLHINLDKVLKKYEGLDGTELAISESQERMAVVIAKTDVERFFALAAAENLEASVVADVTADRRVIMSWRGQDIVNLTREFLNSNGSEKHTRIKIQPQQLSYPDRNSDFIAGYKALAANLNCCLKRGLTERFDSTVGAATVLLPLGGKNQLTPAQVMAAKIPLLKGETNTCSVMSWGFDPYLSSSSPYHGSYLAVVSSVQKLVAAGAPLDKCYMTFQEYFPKLGNDPERWGQPAAALLGAFAAQLDLSLASIGGKDSMSGSFEELDVPPTLVSFAISVADSRKIVSPEFKYPGSKIILMQARVLDNGLPDKNSLLSLLANIEHMMNEGLVHASYVPGQGGIAEAVMKMGFGNDIGFEFDETLPADFIFGPCPAAFILEVDRDVEVGFPIGYTSLKPNIKWQDKEIALSELLHLSESRLEGIFPAYAEPIGDIPTIPDLAVDKWHKPAIAHAAPKFLIPVFPGTNCEYDTVRAIEKAGGKPEVLVINNITPSGVSESVSAFAQAIESAQAIMIPGGFSGGDEPDGSGKFILAFFRNPQITEQVHQLLEQRDGLICGICNGFQALIKLGLLTTGKISPTDADSPTLAFNTIGRLQSKMVHTRVASNKSPWLARTEVGNIYTLPISHSEGRFLCSPELLAQFAARGQIATQYVDQEGKPSMDIHYNPNSSYAAVEGLTSPDGRVFGKMGHAERCGKDLYRNIPGNFTMEIFESAVDYYKI